MEYLADTTIRPPYDDNEYQIQIVDYGQGIMLLSGLKSTAISMIQTFGEMLIDEQVRGCLSYTMV